MTQGQDAARFAETRVKAHAKAANQRQNGHRKAIGLLIAGRLPEAQAVVWSTFEQQVATLGWHLGETADAP